ncbi:PAS domain S-box protein [Salinibacter grassmerensis]|uniref:PAS domain S-box protein n=1 Tax=Salinibacter grassmerensis TaxID=3040353 RepID=UPI0021E6F2B7|nr:PAS domain S-box protein [Salinibacter grassmerensis]
MSPFSSQSSTGGSSDGVTEPTPKGLVPIGTDYSEDDPGLSFREQVRRIIHADGLSSREKIRALLHAGTDRLGIEAGFLSRIDMAESTHRVVAATGGHPKVQAGAESDLTTTYCRKAITQSEVLCLEDAEQQGWETDPAYQEYGLSCYLGAKIIVEGQLYGTVCFGGQEPRPSDPTDEAAMDLLAQSVERILEQERHRQETDQSQEKYDLLLEAAPDPVILADVDTGRLVEVNQKAAELIGASKEQITGRHQTELHPTGEADRYRRLFQKCCRPGAGDRVRRFEDGSPIHVVTDDGENIPVEISAATVEVEERRLAVGIFRDITEQEPRRRTIESSLQAIEEAADGIAVLEDGRYVYVDETHANMYGFESTDALLGESWRRLYNADEVDRLEKEVFPTLEEEGHWQGEVTGSRPDGTTFPATLSLTIASEGRLVCTVRDITDRRQKDRALQHRSSAVEAASDGIAILDADGVYQYVNQAHAAIYGYDAPESLIGESWIICYDEEEEKRLEEEVLATLRQTGQWRGEAQGLRADGSSFSQELSLTALEDGSFVCVVRDITARKEDERKLRSTKQYYEQILEKAVKDLAVFKPDGRYEFVNKQSVKDPEMREWLIGHTNVEYCRKRGLDLELGRQRHRAIRTAAREQRTTQFEERMETESGVRYFMRSHKPITNIEGDVTHVAAFGIDITERKKQEQALQERQDKIEALYEATRRVLTAESPEEVSGRIHELLGTIFDYPLQNTGFVDGDLIRPERTVSESSVPSPQPQPESGDSLSARAVRTGDTVVAENIDDLDNDIEYGKLRSAAAVPIGKRGVVVVGKTEVGRFSPFSLRLLEILSSYAALVLGRLEREGALREAKAEAEMAQAEAEAASRAKSAMLANMSHEIRTPLTSIIGFADAIGEEVQEEESALRFADLIGKSGRRLLSTLDGVLNLSKLEAGKMDLEETAVDIAGQAATIVEELRPRAEDKGLRLRVEARETPAWAQADEGGVQIVLQNLISNAIKYTNDGEVRVRISREAEQAVLDVEDTGIGMDQGMVETLFDPFRQESEGLGREYEGTGLGLTVTKKAIDQMGGSINVETEKGEGSHFTVRFPEPK